MNPSIPNPVPTRKRRGRPPKSERETPEETAARLQRNHENKKAHQRLSNAINRERANARRTSSAGASAIENATSAAPSGINPGASEPSCETDSAGDVEAQSSSSQLIHHRGVIDWISSVSEGMALHTR
jgi:hypothetical protein